MKVILDSNIFYNPVKIIFTDKKEFDLFYDLISELSKDNIQEILGKTSLDKIVEDTDVLVDEIFDGMDDIKKEMKNEKR